MAAFKSIAIAGASGNLGPQILEQLIASNAFAITVLTRESSTATFPSNVTVKKVNYDDVSSLTAALTGIEGVVSTLGSLALDTQIKLIDASIAAGVKRFIPSEFGSDTLNPKAAELPVFASKVKIQKYLKEKAAENKISYTFIITGAFFNWGLKVGFLLNVNEKKGTIYDGGNARFRVTNLETIGQSVVGVFKNPEGTKNKGLKIKDAIVTQNQLVKIVDKFKPQGEWKLEQVSTDALLKSSFDRFNKGDYARDVFSGFLLKAIYSEDYGSFSEGSDNELVGLKTKSEEEIEETIGGIVKG